jgi:hypothetical protein
MTEFRTGWSPELEQRVRETSIWAQFSTRQPLFRDDQTPIPPAFSLSRFRRFPHDQGQAGTCWSNAAVQIVQVHTDVEAELEGKPWEVTRLSRRFNAFFGKLADGTGGNPDDGGVISAALLAMSDHATYGRGCCHEDLWPYPVGDEQAMRQALALAPPPRAVDDAVNNRVSMVADIPIIGELAQRSIMHGHPVGLGMPWPGLWDSMGGTAFSQTGHYSLQSGHAVMLMGWMEYEGERFWQLENSHGPIYRALPPEVAQTIPGYEPFVDAQYGFPGTYDFWVAQEALREVMSSPYAVATVAAGLTGFIERPEIPSFLGVLD